MDKLTLGSLFKSSHCFKNNKWTLHRPHATCKSCEQVLDHGQVTHTAEHYRVGRELESYESLINNPHLFLV
jgi:hypothetical protein